MPAPEDMQIKLPRAEGLDALSHTFSKDLEFCEGLALAQPQNVARIFVYLRWAHNYLNPIQEELASLTAKHFPSSCATDAKLWTLTLTGGIYRDLGLVPYLAVRGLVSIAGFLIRRSLESAGLLAHLWHDPNNAEYLRNPDSKEFKHAFLSETNKKKASDLLSRGLQKRFASSHGGKEMSDLYRIFSGFTVHGDSPKQLVGAQLAPNSFSCMFINRPNPRDSSLAKELELFAIACEMICVEIALLHGGYAKKYGMLPSKGGEGGFYLMRLLDRGSDSDMNHIISATLDDFGWGI